MKILIVDDERQLVSAVEMILKQHYLLAFLFALLLTIILFGIGRIILKMCFGKLSEDKAKIVTNNIKKLTWKMYFPQIIMLSILFILGIHIPKWLYDIITAFMQSLT